MHDVRLRNNAGMSIIRNGVIIRPPPMPSSPAIKPVKHPRRAIRPIVIKSNSVLLVV